MMSSHLIFFRARDLLVYKVFFIAFLLGVLTESFAYHFSLWRYKKPLYLLFNVLMAFTLVQGGIAFYYVSKFPVGHLDCLGLILVFLLGGLSGIIYELYNEKGFRLFDFNSNGILFLKTKKQLVVGVGLGWGFIPLLSTVIYTKVFAI